MDDRAQSVWSQKDAPVILRRNGPCRARLPFAADNRHWLRDNRRTNPDWITAGQYWEFPRAWFNDFVDRALVRYGKVWIIQPYRDKEICARSCMNALGHECHCSCLGANHGLGVEGRWFEVNETLAIRWGPRTLACRL